MATARFDAALRDLLEALSGATRELAAAREPGEIGRKAAEIALRLTRSANASVALTGGRAFHAPSGQQVSARERMRGALMEVSLKVHGEPLGLITVVRASEYTEKERAALNVLAAHVSLALALHQREDRDESPERVERAHDLAVQVLLSVSSHAVQGQNLNDFRRRLARTVGELVGARRVLFWRLGDDGMLAPVPGGYHVDEAILARLRPTPCEPGSDSLASRVVFDDLIFRAAKGDEPPDHDYVLEVLGVSSAIRVHWRAGEERLGLVAAYESTRPGGFSREDAWVLHQVGLAAGILTRLWQSQEDLRKSVERLTKVDGARQLLLRNMTTVVEKERKRVVSELHDDALQKLTAAELQLGRMRAGQPADEAVLDKLRELLEGTESALRRLVFEVRPPSLESPDGLAQSIRERVAMLSAEGIEVDLQLDLPAEMSGDLRTMVFRQISEAASNVERHSQATRVWISVKVAEGGVLGVVRDDGHGFVVAERSNLPGHLGLLALRERALMAGGRYKIESRPGAGTLVEFWLPLDQ